MAVQDPIQVMVDAFNWADVDVYCEHEEREPNGKKTDLGEQDDDALRPGAGATTTLGTACHHDSRGEQDSDKARCAQENGGGHGGCDE